MVHFVKLFIYINYGSQNDKQEIFISIFYGKKMLHVFTCDLQNFSERPLTLFHTNHQNIVSPIMDKEDNWRMKTFTTI